MDFVNNEKSGAAKKTTNGSPKEVEMEVSSTDGDKLFSCPEDGCVCTFMRYHNLEHHLTAGKCKLFTERYTLLDKAKLGYVQKLSEGSSCQPLISSTLEDTSNSPMSKGWALKASKKSSRFNSNQKQYLDDRFTLGQETGNKADPENVAKDMRHAKNMEGERRFTVDEFLTPQQIKSYFSRKAAKKKNVVHDEAMEDESAYSSAREHILQECQLTHPITYDTYNICQLNNTGRLKKLNLKLLRCICNYFHYDVNQLPLRRKQPYIDLISNLAATCSCNSK